MPAAFGGVSSSMAKILIVCFKWYWSLGDGNVCCTDNNCSFNDMIMLLAEMMAIKNNGTRIKGLSQE